MADDLRGSKLLLDTNIVVDFLGRREPFFADVRLLMVLGKVHEFQLWVSASQVTDVVYILSNGGRKDLLPKACAAVDSLLDFVGIFAAGEDEVRRAMRCDWTDPEDALIHEVACKLQAAAIITRNKKDFAKSLVPVYGCKAFFDKLRDAGISYQEVGF